MQHIIIKMIRLYLFLFENNGFLFILLISLHNDYDDDDTYLRYALIKIDLKNNIVKSSSSSL